MVPDYHIHASLCKHAEGEIEDYLEVARQKELTEVCITDHAPNPDGYDQKHRMTLDEFELYREKVRAVSVMPGDCILGRAGASGSTEQAMVGRGRTCPSGRRPVSTSARPSVLFGIEADYYDGCKRFLKEWLPRQNLDLVIGSIHYIHNWGFDNPDEREVWDNVDVGSTWRMYFELVIRLAQTRLFDAVGHFDLPKKFGYRPPEKEIREMLPPVLDEVARANMAIEINTSGLRKPVKEIYPGIMALELAYARGIPICFGSDAHRPEEVGHEFAAGVAWARQAGYSEAVRFAGRKKIKYALPVT